VHRNVFRGSGRRATETTILRPFGIAVPLSLYQHLPLHRFLSLLESRSEFAYPTRLLADAIGTDAERALCDAGVLAPRGTTAWYPCAKGLRGCRRVVAAEGTRLHVLCGRSSGECATETLGAEDLGQHILEESALVRLLQQLFEVDGQAVRGEGRGQPLCIGKSDGGCDVWLWLRPREPEFAIWMSHLENRPRGARALVLVPTGARIYTDTFERYGPSQPITVVYLDRALTVVDGRVVRSAPATEASARVPWPADTLVERRGARLNVPAGIGWSHIVIEYVNDDVVAVRVGALSPVRLTAAELGLTHVSNGRASELWRLLVALCEGHGTCTRANVGTSIDALKTRVRRLSDQLCRVFRLPDLPLHVDSATESVRADFRAAPETRRAATRRRRM
jgi:hypothetical protein